MPKYPGQPRIRSQRVLSEIAALTESIEQRSRRCTPPGQYFCPICRRNRLQDPSAFWSHMRAVHTPEQFIAAPFARDQGGLELMGSVEDGLVQIVNSETHEQAVEIATAVLMGTRK